MTYFRLGTPVLCSSFLSPNLLAVGTHCRDVYLIDLRSPIEHSTRMRHKKSVLCMDAAYEIGLRLKNNSENYSDLNLFNPINTMPLGDQFCLDDHSELSSIVASDECLDSFGLVDPFELVQDNVSNDIPKVDKFINSTISGGDQASNSLSNINLITGSSDQFLAGWDLRNGSEPVFKYKVSRCMTCSFVFWFINNF